MTVFEKFDNTREVIEEYLLDWNLIECFDAMLQARRIGDEKLMIKAANAAWAALPDRPGIRTEGFFELCDIAEEIFA